MEHFKAQIALLLSGITAYLAPISGEITSLIILFGVNFACGLLAALLVSKEGFSFKKAFRCIIEAATFFVLVSSVYSIGEHKGNPDGALQCVSFISYSIIWFYGVNILKNLKLVFKPETLAGRVFTFLHHVVSIEFIKKIPYLSNYINNTTACEK